MRHLTTYSLFERVSKETKLFESSRSEIIEEIKQICFDLTDFGKFEVSISTLSDNFLTIHIKSNDSTFKGFPFSEVEDVIIRLHSYLGDMLMKIKVSLVGDIHITPIKYDDDSESFKIYDKSVWTSFSPRKNISQVSATVLI